MELLHCVTFLTFLTAVLSTVPAVPSHYRALNQAQYTAAVVEFSPVESETDPPSLILSTNINEYKNFVLEAKAKGADIVVFPEYGLTSTLPSSNRSMARDFAQLVPDPENGVVPCDTFNQTMEQETMRRLSCFAKESQIYVVANLLEKLPCPGCAGDDLLLFNTNVALDRSGTVVARYRKFNLFNEVALNQTEEADIATFDADFGAKFGLITCFDIMFEHPAVTLVTEFNVTDVIFPTAWIQELPFLTGIQTQLMWAYAMGVNVLGSGYNNPRSGSGGSGIYNGQSGVVIDVIPWEKSSLLLLGEVPGGQSNEIKYKNSTGTPPFYYQEDLTNYTTLLIDLNNDRGYYQVCHQALCCNVEISATISDTTVFRIIVFNGERSFGGGFYTHFKIQTCGVIRCKHADDPVRNCALIMSDVTDQVQINHLKISANFSNDAIIGPNFVDGQFNVLTGDLINFNKIIGEFTSDITLELSRAVTENILTFALWGRVYPKTPGFNEKLTSTYSVVPIVIGSIFAFSALMVVLVIVSYKCGKDRMNSDA